MKQGKFKEVRRGYLDGDCLIDNKSVSKSNIKKINFIEKQKNETIIR